MAQGLGPVDAAGISDGHRVQKIVQTLVVHRHDEQGGQLQAVAGQAAQVQIGGQVAHVLAQQIIGRRATSPGHAVLFGGETKGFGQAAEQARVGHGVVQQGAADGRRIRSLHSAGRGNCRLF